MAKPPYPDELKSESQKTLLDSVGFNCQPNLTIQRVKRSRFIVAVSIDGNRGWQTDVTSYW